MEDQTSEKRENQVIKECVTRGPETWQTTIASNYGSEGKRQPTTKKVAVESANSGLLFYGLVPRGSLSQPTPTLFSPSFCVGN